MWARRWRQSSSSLKPGDAPEDMVVVYDRPITRDAHIWSLTQPTPWIPTQPYG